ncbi:hypothetical protein [Oceanobacillus sp. FSL W7-1304]|uniref:hypothetical protein n=1 Tax=Oceanobacillus sp. FSL W7-1304 TaxID=2975322 RepID=UPI0030DA26D9
MIGSIQKYKKKQGIRYRYTVDLNQDGVRKQKKKSGFLLAESSLNLKNTEEIRRVRRKRLEKCTKIKI